MSYSRSDAKITAVLPAVLAIREIEDELEKKAIRRDVLEKEVSNRAKAIWHAVAARVDAFEATEKTIETVKSDTVIPEYPPYLEWIGVTSVGLLSLMLLAGLVTIGFGFFKGWSVVASTLTGVLTWRNWILVIGAVVSIVGVSVVWQRSRYGRFSQLIEAAKKRENAQLAPLTQQLEAEKKILDEALQQVVASEVRDIIAQKRTSWFGLALPDGKADGLSQVQNPEYEIITPAEERLRRTMDAMNGASIGVSGPRGAGKTTLLWSNYQIGNTRSDVLTVFTSAPVEYDARDFVLHLFGSVCSRIIEKAVGRIEFPTRTERARRDHWAVDRSRVYADTIFMFPGALLISVGAASALLKAQAAATPQGAKTSTPFMDALVTALGLNPGTLLVWGLVFLIVPILARPYVRSWLRRRDSHLNGSIEELEEEYEASLEMRAGSLVASAYRQLSNIKFQQSYTSGWSGALKLPVAFEGAMKSDRSWIERQRTLPDIVDDYTRFLNKIVGSEKTPYKKVVVCIDELDKLESDEAAQRFINSIKSVFHQARCYYLVSISENAMSSFERRGLPIRDAFDSSFDEVIQVEYQPLASSKRLLSRRVLNVPDPFLCFCHVLAGGLPRDLIRVCRAVFEARSVVKINNLSDICAEVLYVDVRTKLRAIAVAAERQPDLSPTFLSHVLVDPPRRPADIWKLIEALESDQPSRMPDNDGASRKTPLATEALLYMYFAVTMLELFGSMDEARWLKGESEGLFDRLASVRRSISQNPRFVVEAIAAIRSTFGLSARAGTAA
jgi:hypothetical protein